MHAQFLEENLSLPEQDAFCLSRAAIFLDRAMTRGEADELAAALDHNLELWAGIRALVIKPGNGMPANVRDNLVRLSGFVADTTISWGVKITRDVLNTLININLQISEGLLEGVTARPA